MNLTRTTGLIVSFVVCMEALFGDIAWAAEPAPAKQLFPADPENAVPIEATLYLPLAGLQKLSADESGSFDAELLLADGDRLELRISPRGKSRRRECKFPPLLFDFKKKSTKGTIFTGQNKLKLVTHCSRKFANREYLAAEMLVYRLFNMLTDNSFRVHAMQIKYVDSDEPGDPGERHYAFLIEHKKSLARRLQAEVFETRGLELSELVAHQAALVGMFGYMVANTDFSVRRGPGEECCHNVVPLVLGGDTAAVPDKQKVLVVPYDFDATGLVNPPYASPSPAMKIRRVTQRLYRGYCAHNTLLPELVDEFLNRKEDLLGEAAHFDDIPGLRRERAGKYLQFFFDTIATERSLQDKILKHCR